MSSTRLSPDYSGSRSGQDRLEHEARGPFKDPIVGDQRNTEPKSGSRDPAIGVVLALAQGVTDPLAGDAKLGVDADEVAAGVHDLGASDLSLHAPKPRVAPTSEERAVANLGDGLEGDELGAAEQQRFVAERERGVGDETSAEHVGVDDDRSPTRLPGHDVSSVQRRGTLRLPPG